MAAIIKTDKLGQYRLNGTEQLNVYCGLDVLMTQEVFAKQLPLLDSATAGVYEFEKSMLAPALTMMRRGFALDYEWANEYAKQLEADAMLLGGMAKVGYGKKGKWRWKVKDESALLQQYAFAVWGKPLNFHSDVQLKEFLYEALWLPEYYEVAKGKGRVSVGYDALVSLGDHYLRAKPICKVLIELSHIEAVLGILYKKTLDGRMRCTYDPAGTETGRWASRKAPKGDGTNLQNQNKELRRFFVADPGYVMFQADLEQAESRVVAYLAQDENYIRACEGGDLHTTVSSMVFGIPEERDEADRVYYKDYTYRFLSKKAGHGSNYLLSPRSLANKIKVPVREAVRFYLLYLGGELEIEDARKWNLMDAASDREGDIVFYKGAFEKIRTVWHEEVRTKLLADGTITTDEFHRRRKFHGDPCDDAVVREGVAYEPQSIVGDKLNAGLLAVYKRHDLPVLGGPFQLLGQAHDAIVGQIHKSKVDEILPSVVDLLSTPMTIRGRQMTIPVDVKVGYNWKEWDKKKPEENPKGLKSWKPVQITSQSTATPAT